MTWTLRFYEEDDTEIGWVTADPWQVEITHPKAAEYEEVRLRIDSFKQERPSLPEYRDSEFRLIFEPSEFTDTKPHLEYVRERLEESDDFVFSLEDE